MKYHIGKDGKIRPCKAVKRHCRLTSFCSNNEEITVSHKNKTEEMAFRSATLERPESFLKNGKSLFRYMSENELKTFLQKGEVIQSPFNSNNEHGNSQRMCFFMENMEARGEKESRNVTPVDMLDVMPSGSFIKGSHKYLVEFTIRDEGKFRTSTQSYFDEYSESMEGGRILLNEAECDNGYSDKDLSLKGIYSTDKITQDGLKISNYTIYENRKAFLVDNEVIHRLFSKERKQPKVKFVGESIFEVGIDDNVFVVMNRFEFNQLKRKSSEIQEKIRSVPKDEQKNYIDTKLLFDVQDIYKNGVIFGVYLAKNKNYYKDEIEIDISKVKVCVNKRLNKEIVSRIEWIFLKGVEDGKTSLSEFDTISSERRKDK